MGYASEKLAIEEKLIARAAEELRLFTKDGWAAFRDLLERPATDAGANTGVLLRGFSQHSIKKMRNAADDKQWPTVLPRLVVRAIYEQTHIDVTGADVQDFFDQLREGVSLHLAATKDSAAGSIRDAYTLRDLKVQFHEITAKIPGPDDEELLLRIYFDETSLIVTGEGSAPRGKNTICGELTADSDLEAEAGEDGYRGRIILVLHDVTPELRWKLKSAKIGGALQGLLEAEGQIASISVEHGAPLRAILTAPEQGLVVEIIAPDGAARRSLSQSEKHREKMRQAVMRKDIVSARSQFEIYSLPLVGRNSP